MTKNKQHKINIMKVLASSLIMIFIWTMIASKSPFYLDDWGWAGQSFAKNGSYGGRFLGNFAEIILAASHNQLLNGFVKALVLTFICLMLCLISGKISFTRIIVFNSFFLLTSMRIVYESFLWTAGFVNYTLPFVFVLPVILINQNLKKKNFRPAVSILLKSISLICIFASGFFLENLSTTVIVYLILELVLNFIFYKKNWVYHIIALLTSVASFVTMMLHSERFINKDGYGRTSFHSLQELIHNIKEIHLLIVNNLFHNNVFLLVIIAFLFGLSLVLVLPKMADKKEKWLYYLTSLQFFLLFLCPTYQLVIVNPNVINARIFYPSIIVLIMAGMILFASLEERVSNKSTLRYFTVLIFILSLVFPSLFFADMANWNKQIQTANEQAIAKKIEIDYSQMKPKYHEYYYYDANGPLIGQNWIDAYKVYYNIPKEVNIK